MPSETPATPRPTSLGIDLLSRSSSPIAAYRFCARLGVTILKPLALGGLVHLGGVLPGDHPPAHRSQHQRLHRHAARPQGKRHRRPPHPRRYRHWSTTATSNSPQNSKKWQPRSSRRSPQPSKPKSANSNSCAWKANKKKWPPNNDGHPFAVYCSIQIGWPKGGDPTQDRRKQPPRQMTLCQQHLTSMATRGYRATPRTSNVPSAPARGAADGITREVFRCSGMAPVVI